MGKDTGVKLKPIHAATLLAIYEFWINQEEDEVPMPVAPGVRTLMPVLGLASTNTVNARLERLRGYGLVEDAHWRPGIRLTWEGFERAKELYDLKINA